MSTKMNLDLIKLPRKAIPSAHKEAVWFRIQNYIRANRPAEKPVKSGFRILPTFRFGTVAMTALSVAIAIGLIGGATKASEGSLPGETLYTVKKVAEKVEQALATNNEAKVKVGIKHAKKRLEEVKILVAENQKPEIVNDTLAELKTTTQQVLTIAGQVKPELLDQAQEIVTEGEEVLITLEEDTQTEAKKALQEILDTSRESLSRLKENREAVEGAAVEDAAATTTTEEEIAPQTVKHRIKDAPISSPVQIDEVIQIEKEPADDSGEPIILEEPTRGF